jgi:phosphatidylglycerophosphate synthase
MKESTREKPGRSRFPRPKPPEALYSESNIITLVRVIVSLVLFALAAVKNRELLNYIGLACHCFGDMLDGFYSRTFKQETVLGAEIDIIADRLGFLFFFINFIHFHPALLLPVLVFILDFAFVDFYLSYQFLKYDIISINYFYKVDRKVYSLNFSPAAKTLNSSLVPAILFFLPGLWVLALVLAAGLVVLKLYSVSLLWKKGRAPGVGSS